MVWSQLSIKILGVHFCNSGIDNCKWNKINHSLTKRNSIFVTDCNSPWDEEKKKEKEL